MADGAKVATDGATNCTLAYSVQIDDLTSYQVTQSLASFHLDSAVRGLVTWADPDAVNVQTDIANVIRARTPQTGPRPRPRAQRAAGAGRPAGGGGRGHGEAITALSANAAAPKLPG